MFRKASELVNRHGHKASRSKRRRTAAVKRVESLEERRMLTGYAEDVLALNPLAFWEFNEGTGTTAIDSSGNGNDGVITNQNYVAGRTGLAGDSSIDFTADGGIDIPSASTGFNSIGSQNQVTLSMWINGDPGQQPRNNTTVYGVNGGTRIVHTHAPWGNSNIYWDSGACCGGDGRINAATTAANFEGAWNYYTMVKDGTTDFSAIYINGQELVSSTNSTADLAGMTELVLGQSHRGQLDDVAIFDQALSVAQIQDLFNSASFNAASDRATVNGPATIDVLSNDLIPPNPSDTVIRNVDGQALNAGDTITLSGGQGTVTLEPTGELTYDPGSFTGQASFTYFIETTVAVGNPPTIRSDTGTVNVFVLSPGSFLWDGASDGDGDGTNFSDPNNWAGDAVPGAGDTAVFGDTAPGTVNTAGQTVSELLLIHGGSNQFDFVGTGLNATNVTKSGDATTVFDADLTAASFQIDAGRTELNSLTNSIGDVTVNDGLVVVGTQGNANGFGGADVEIVDGTVQFFGIAGLAQNAIAHYGFHVNDDNNALNLNNNGGIMGGGDPTSHPNFNALVALTDGPGGRGLDFNNDGDFINSGAIGQNDNYSNLFLTTITVDAASAGDWAFDFQADDDRVGFWIDLDQDGVFESDGTLNDNRGEQITWDDGTERTVTLAAGEYLAAFIHREGGGGSQIEMQFTSPTVSKRTIRPTDPAQAGIFSANGVVGSATITNNFDILGDGEINTGDVPGVAITGNVEFGSGAVQPTLTTTVNGGTLTIADADLLNHTTIETTGAGPTIMQSIDDGAGTFDLTKTGGATLELPNDNTFGGAVTVVAGSLLAQAAGSLGDGTGSTTVEDGGQLALDGGFTLAASETITINGNAAGGSLLNISGDNVIDGDVILATDSQIGLAGGNLTINGNVTLTGSLTVDTGAADRSLTINGVVSGAGDITLANDGVVRLTNGANDFTGAVNVPTGILQLTADGTLGDPATGTTISGDGTVQFDGTFDHASPETFTVSSGGEGGIGALSNLSGDTVLSSPVVIAGHTTIGSESDTLTVESDLALGLYGLTLTGAAGTVVLNGDISSEVIDAAYSVEFGTNRSDDPTQIYVDLNQDGVFRTADSERVVDRGCCGNSFNTITIAPGTYRYLAAHREGGGGSQTEPTIDLFNTGRRTVQPGAMNGLFSTSDDANAIFGFGATTVIPDQLDAYAFISPSRNDVHLDDIGEDNGGTPLAIQGGPQSILRENPVSHITIDGADRIDYRNDGEFRNGNAGRSVQGFDASEDGLPGINQNDDYATAFYGLLNIPLLAGLGSITKIGDGTAILNGDNTFAGEVSVNGGTLIAGTNTALSDTASQTVVGAAGTLGLQGGVTIDEPVSLNGTLANVAGDNTYTGTITGPTGPFQFAIESWVTGDTFTIDTDVDQQDGTLVLGGDGDTVINGVISGNGTPLGFNNGLAAQRFETGSNQLDFSAQGGGAYTLNADATISQSAGLLSTPPSSTGLQDFGDMNFDRDGNTDPNGASPYHWQALLPTAPGGDTGNFQVVWTGMFVPDANGDFQFRSHDINGTGGNVDDDASIYVDTNLNGIFEASEGFSSGGGQTFTATGLQAGVGYPVVFGYREGGGDEEVSYTIQGSAGSLTTETMINPATQPGMWGLPTGSNNSVIKRGNGMVTLAANNTYNGPTTVESGTLVAADAGALGDTAATTTVASGGSLGLAGDITLSAEDLELNGPGANGQGALVNVSGNNTVSSNLTIPAASINAGELGIGSLDGVLTVDSDLDLLNNHLTVNGAGDVVINGTIFSSDTSANLQSFSPGLVERVYDVRNIDDPFGDPLLSDTVQTGPRAGYFTTNQGPWAIDGGNETIVYTGEFFDDDGIFSFTGQIDDDMLILVDGVQVLRSTAWNVVKTTAINDGYDGGNEVGNANPNGGTVDFGMGPNGDGWHSIEFRFANGGGGEGAVGNDGWTTSFGFGLANPASGNPNDLPGVDGSATGDGTELDGTNPAFMVADDPGDGSLFRYATVTAGNVANTLTKGGTGNLTLSAANAYIGDTTINGVLVGGNDPEGAIIVTNTTGSATGAGNVFVDNWGSFAGTGSINGWVQTGLTGMVEVGPDLGESPIVASTLTVGSADINGFAIFDITDTGNDTLAVSSGGMVMLDMDFLDTAGDNSHLYVYLEDGTARPTDGQEFTLIDQLPTAGLIAGTFIDPNFGAGTPWPAMDPADTSAELEEGDFFQVRYDADPAPDNVPNAGDGIDLRYRMFQISYVGGADGNDLVITHVNRAPVGIDDTINAPDSIEDVPVTSDFTANDPDNDPITAPTITDDVDNGTLVDNGDGTFTYTPDPFFSGTDAFNFLANDGELPSPTEATITINVAPVANDPTFSVPATLNAMEDVAINLGITAASVDTDGSEQLDVTIAGIPVGATIDWNDGAAQSFTATAGNTSLTLVDTDQAVLDTVTVTGALNDATDFTLSVTATITDSVTFDDATTATDTVTTAPLTIFMEVVPVVDGATPSAGTVTGTENTVIDLQLGGGSSDPDEVITLVTVSDVPADAVLTDSAGNPYTEVSPGTYEFTDPALLTGLSIIKEDGDVPFTAVTLQVSFEATDVDPDNGNMVSLTSPQIPLNVEVANTPPNATITFTGSGQTVTGFPTPFDVTANDANPNDDPFTYTVDWGDGSPIETFDNRTAFESLTHPFANFGTITVTVTATDADGETGAPASTTIEVVPVAVIDGDIYAGGTGNSDTIIYYPSNAGVRVRYNTSFFGPFPVQADTQLLAFGQGGNDRIIVAGDIGVPAVFDGGVGNDYLAGLDTDDTLIGGGGNDILLGGEGNNLFIGDDRPDDDPSDDAMPGSDRIEGRSGIDYAFGGGGNDRINGGGGDDVLDGGLGNDYLFGGLGNDFLYGGGGSDVINGHFGNDVIFGGADSDQIFGSNDHDLIVAGTGRDRVRGDAGDDDIVGGTSSIDTQIEAALDAILAGTVEPDLATADPAVDLALQMWFMGQSRAGFGGFTSDGVSEDLAGGSGSDEVHAGDGLRDFRIGEDSTF